MKLSVKVVAVFLMLAVVTPAFGSICTMPCGSGTGGSGSSCCCRGSGAADVVSLSNPSCCEPEMTSGNAGTSFRDRAAGNSAPAPLVAAAGAADVTAAPLETGQEGFPADDHTAGRARSSPLFLLNASFII